MHLIRIGPSIHLQCAWRITFFLAQRRRRRRNQVVSLSRSRSLSLSLSVSRLTMASRVNTVRRRQRWRQWRRDEFPADVFI